MSGKVAQLSFAQKGKMCFQKGAQALAVRHPGERDREPPAHDVMEHASPSRTGFSLGAGRRKLFEADEIMPGNGRRPAPGAAGDPKIVDGKARSGLACRIQQDQSRGAGGTKTEDPRGCGNDCERRELPGGLNDQNGVHGQQERACQAKKTD